LEIKNRVLEEAEVSFAVAPRARNGHKIGGKVLFEGAKLLVIGLSRDVRENPVGHLGRDGLDRYRIRHGRGGVRCLPMMRARPVMRTQEQMP
jgi:hypothetical protein